MRIVRIIDTKLMRERLSQKMIEKGYVHKNGNPHQKLLADAVGVQRLQPTISSILREEQKGIREDLLTILAKALNVQEQWLLGGEYVPLQEKPLFKEESYQPEQKNSEKGNSDIVGTLEKISEALYMIMRQLQKMNKEDQNNG